MASLQPTELAPVPDTLKGKQTTFLLLVFPAGVSVGTVSNMAIASSLDSVQSKNNRKNSNWTWKL